MGIDFYENSILPWAGIIIKICRAYTNSQEEFEDYYQEVCLQIWRSREAFAKQSNWSTWIYRVALNVCMTNSRTRSRQREQVATLKQEATIASAAHIDHADDQIEALYRAIRQLRDADRAVILLYLEEKSYREIAEIIGTNPNNIGVRISRIKEKLSTLLAEKDSEND